ncbi:MAG: hypothetical protein IKJ73_11405 [Lachnospiraceae bacterium]|nr:hypothetical protein [Lachnospiraceae bacterium]
MYTNKDEQEYVAFMIKWEHYAQELLKDLNTLSLENQNRVINTAVGSVCMKLMSQINPNN